MAAARRVEKQREACNDRVLEVVEDMECEEDLHVVVSVLSG